MRVLTFNIGEGAASEPRHRWAERWDLVVDVVRDNDVVGLQEARPDWLAAIAQALPGYAIVHGHPYGRLRPAHAPILFDAERYELGRDGSFWLSDRPDERSVGWDASMSRVCTWAALRDRSTGTRVVVFNTHLDHRGAEARTRAAELIAARSVWFADRPRLIIGDLNAAPDDPPLRVLSEAGFRSAYDGVGVTFHGFTGVRTIGRIDHVLCDARWTVRGAEIIADTPASDHYAVAAEVTPIA